LSAEGNKPRPGAGRRAWPGPKSQSGSNIGLRSAYGRDVVGGDPSSLSHIIGPIPLSRSDPLRGICLMTPEICSMRPSRWGVLSSTSGQSAAHRPALLARNGRSMRAGECLFLGEKRSCSGHHCTARRRAQAIVAHVAAVKAARTGIALCRAQVAIFQRRNAAKERRRQGGPSC
jgi:hypothetical protein